MTKLNGSFEDGETSNSSFGGTSTDESILNSKIIEEEERLSQENEKAEENMFSVALANAHDEELAKKLDESEIQSQKELPKEGNNYTEKSDEELARQVEAELKAMRYKKLMHLLDSSKMYSIILKDRIKEETNSRQKGNLKRYPGSNGKKKKQSDYNLGDIISEENIDENEAASDSKPQQIIDDEDYFKETRVTSMGFKVSSKQPILLEGATMRDYQLKGLEWLKVMFKNGVNGILGDEMGLGKTIQVISFICHMIEQNIKGPFLIVAPLSTVANWMIEFKRFAPKVPIMLYHGTNSERRELLPKILHLTKVLDKSVHKVVITSFQVPLRDAAQLQRINWYYLIVDEGQRIKNHKSLLARTLKGFSTIGRLLLTGTPLQNDLSELWSLLNFLLPEVFNALDVFESWFDINDLESKGASFMIEKFNLNIMTILQEILLPFMLRREKKDVDLMLPPKKEVLIYCPLTHRQKTLYESILDRSIELLVKPEENVDITAPLPKRKCFLNSPYGKRKDSKASADNEKENSPPKKTKKEVKKNKKDEKKEEEKEEERYLTKVQLVSPQMLLRKVVNHPYLIQYPLETGTENFRIDEDLVRQAGKMLVLDALLTKLKALGHKVVLFSYFKLVLDILEDYAHLRNYNYCRLDGELAVDKRNEEIERFNTDPEVFVFLVTMRSGGLGINLTSADTVIFYDSDWNPQVNLQSQDRCHRIGQNKPVVIYRLCVKGTIDEKIIERGKVKRRLEKMILQKGKYAHNSGFSKKLSAMDLQELKSLVESTDHDVVINSNGFVLTDEQLDNLLDRSNMATDAGEKYQLD